MVKSLVMNFIMQEEQDKTRIWYETQNIITLILMYISFAQEFAIMQLLQKE